MDGICSISDVHVRSSTDERYISLLRFLDSPEVDSSHFIVLLGDIFDLMIGNHAAVSYTHLTLPTKA